MNRSFILAAVAVLATACGSSNSSPMTPSNQPAPGGGTTAADVTITIQANNGANSFAPNPSTVKVGQRVAWRNGDTITHNATQDTAGGFQTGNLAAGATSATITMNTAGTFTYHCTLHQGMVGTLVVQP